MNAKNVINSIKINMIIIDILKGKNLVLIKKKKVIFFRAIIVIEHLLINIV